MLGWNLLQHKLLAWPIADGVHAVHRTAATQESSQGTVLVGCLQHPFAAPGPCFRCHARGVAGRWLAIGVSTERGHAWVMTLEADLRSCIQACATN